MKKLYYIIFSLFLITSCLPGHQKERTALVVVDSIQQVPAELPQVKAEEPVEEIIRAKWLIDQDFNIDGKTIDPKIISTFTPWLSDDRPSVLSMDVLEANSSNQYFSGYTVENEQITFTDEEDNIFSYTHMGTLENGVHIVRVYESTVDESGVFSTLLFFGFTQEKIDIDGELKDQLILHLLKSYCLGYKSDVKIVLNSQSVLIDKPCNSETPVEVFAE